MPIWIIYALIATLFAGVTGLLVKLGISNISAELGLLVRISVVFIIVCINFFAVNGHKESTQLNAKTLFYLIISGITTACCWIFYYKAIKLGEVAVISAIDKGSIVITILLAVTILGEPFTTKLAIGTGLIILGTIVLIWK